MARNRILQVFCGEWTRLLGIGLILPKQRGCNPKITIPNRNLYSYFLSRPIFSTEFKTDSNPHSNPYSKRIPSSPIRIPNNIRIPTRISGSSYRGAQDFHTCLVAFLCSQQFKVSDSYTFRLGKQLVRQALSADN